MTYLQIVNPGNSGCTIRLIVQHNKPFIRKETSSIAYAKRLERQRIKQIYYHSRLPSHIITPKVIDYGAGWFSMEYVPMVDNIIFFERKKPTSILLQMDYLLAFISDNISQSNEEELDKVVIFDKLSQIKNKIKKKTWRKYYKSYENILYGSLKIKHFIPIGPCHGDLSLSNVLFSLETDKVCLLDFLDSFIETPLVDIIKLRQDTMFHWTSVCYPKDFDRAKIEILNTYLNKIICKRFEKQIQLEGFKILEILNYLRLVPYVKSVASHEFIVKSLEKLMQVSYYM